MLDTISSNPGRPNLAYAFLRAIPTRFAFLRALVKERYNYPLLDELTLSEYTFIRETHMNLSRKWEVQDIGIDVLRKAKGL